MGRLRLTEVLLALSIPVCGAAWAQAPDANQPNEWKRATTTHRPAAYPKVGSDGGGLVPVQCAKRAENAGADRGRQ